MELGKDYSEQVLTCLLNGDRTKCSEIVNELLNNDLPVFEVYESVLKKALYKVGKLWEYNKISVATEHLASAIVESIIGELYYNHILTPKN